MQQGMSSTTELVNVHKHAIGTAASFVYLRPSDDVRKQFEKHFSNSMGISDADAICHYINTLMLNNNNAVFLWLLRSVCTVDEFCFHEF